MPSTITRPQAAASLDAKLKRLAAEVKQADNTDAATGYGPDIDDALNRMAKDDINALTMTIEVAAFLVVARFYALTRFAALLATRVDTESFAVEGDRETIFNNVMALRKQAAHEAATYGYILETNDDSWVGSANQPVDSTGVDRTWERTYFGTEYLSAVPPWYPAPIDY